MVQIDRRSIIHLIRTLEERFRNEKNFIDKLDREVGDGDHGTNMRNSIIKARESLSQSSITDVGTMLQTIGDTFIRVGGGIGTFLYGNSIKASSKELVGKKNIDIKDFKMLLSNMSREIEELGEVKIGDKTMYDVLFSVVKEFSSRETNCEKTALEELENMSIVADRAMLETKNMVAKKGRASYFGEKSVGHIDAGAYSMYIILLTIYEFYNEQKIAALLKKMDI